MDKDLEPENTIYKFKCDYVLSNKVSQQFLMNYPSR